MRAILSLIRASWLVASSYRLGMIFSIVGLVLTVIPTYFVANALQPVLANAIQNEGKQYFSFVMIGAIAATFLPIAIHGLPSAIASGLNSGTLESIWGTPATIPQAMVGLTGYGFLWNGIRALLTITAASLLGARIDWSHAPAAALILALTILSYVPFGLIAAAMVLAFRTTGPIPQAILVVSTLFGGVYFPTHVIPSWLERVSAFVPLSYGLRALRRVFLEGLPLTAVWGDLLMLLAMNIVLLSLGVLVFNRAFHYARRAGTLGQY
jgi:ABC-2 type transport system permease protein